MAATKQTRRKRGKDGSDPSGEFQDRIEAVAQFLMLHRSSLSQAQSKDMDRWLAEVRS